jgi:hypothetical protein
MRQYQDEIQFVKEYSQGKASFGKKQMLVPSSQMEISFSENVMPEINLANMTVKGTCQTVEKPYFRLTSAPDPADVRSEEVLEKSLKLISKKWKKRQNDYRYIDEQFRSMR